MKKLILLIAIATATTTAQADTQPTAWTEYAESKGLSTDADWKRLESDWSSVELGSIPEQEYPNPKPYDIKLFHNGLTSLGGLYSIEAVKDDLLLYANELQNVDELANLTYVGKHLLLFYNDLRDVNGLSNLYYVGMLDLTSNPYLSDLSGLSGIMYAEEIIIDSYQPEKFQATVSGAKPQSRYKVKIPQDAWLCKPEQASVFTKAKQEEICEL